MTARLLVEDDITKLPPNADALENLHFRLVLSRFATPEPPPAIFRLKNLRRLHLETYGLKRIPDAIGELTELRELIVSSPWVSEVGDISPKLGALDKLEVLEIHGSKLTRLPDSIQALRALRVLKVKAYALEALPDLTALPALETLWIDTTTLGVPEQVMRLPKLRDLRLWRAKAVPDWLWKATHLRHLGLETVDPARPLRFDALPDLEGVWLHGGKFALPEAVAALPHLRVLDVRDLSVAELPPALFRAGDRDRDGAPLEVLRVARSGLTKIPAAIEKLTRLRELALPENALKDVPDTLGRLTALSRLDLRENAIGRLPAGFAALTDLEDVDLHKNKIAALPADIGALQKLTSLDLGANRLAELPPSFFTLKRLRTLSLAGNLLASVPVALAELRALESLLLQSNPATKGRKNKDAEALLAGLASARTGAAAAPPVSAQVIAVRSRLQTGDVDGAAALITGQAEARALVPLLDDADGNVRARALGVLAAKLVDPFAKGALDGAEVLVVGQLGSLKRTAVKRALDEAGARLVTKLAATGARSILVMGERPGDAARPEGAEVAALPQLARWLVAKSAPHLASGEGREDAATELGALLRSAASENVSLGLRLAEEGGVPHALFPLVLAIARAHGDAKVRRSAGLVWDRHAPADVKLAVHAAFGKNHLLHGKDEKVDKPYAALAGASDFDLSVESLAVEVLRLSRIGIGYGLALPSPWVERALDALLRNGELHIDERVRVTRLPEAIGALGDRVRSFRLSDGNITALPERFAELRDLESVEIGPNELRALPASLLALPRLRHLSLFVGGVRNLDDLSRLTQLESLDLSYVRVPMPDAIGSLRKLVRLRFVDYQGRDLSPALASLDRLEHLDVAGHNFTALPPVLEPLLGRLKTLKIRLPAEAIDAIAAAYPQLTITER